MPRFNFLCGKCGHLEEDVVVSNWHSIDGSQMPRPCPQCEATMEKQPAAPNFAVKGYSARNHYGAKDE